MGEPAGRMGGGDRKRGEGRGMPDPIPNGIFTAGHPKQAGRADAIGNPGAAAGDRGQRNRTGAVGGEGAQKSGGCTEEVGRYLGEGEEGAGGI